MYMNFVYYEELNIINLILIKQRFIGDEVRKKEKDKIIKKFVQIVKDFGFYFKCNGILKLFTKLVIRFGQFKW